MDVKAEIDRLPIDLLAHIFVLASGVCKKWKQGVKESLARRHNLSFTGWKMDDDSTAHLVYHAYNLTKLDIALEMDCIFEFINFDCTRNGVGVRDVSYNSKYQFALFYLSTNHEHPISMIGEAWLHGKTKADSVGNVPCYLELVLSSLLLNSSPVQPLPQSMVVVDVSPLAPKMS
ncbi:hypothetical protein JHK87_050435 [Glycine soja]|nr:hypothetical protein JHK87_050435 [Glycine soja]